MEAVATEWRSSFQSSSGCCGLNKVGAYPRLSCALQVAYYETSESPGLPSSVPVEFLNAVCSLLEEEIVTWSCRQCPIPNREFQDWKLGPQKRCW